MCVRSTHAEIVESNSNKTESDGWPYGYLTMWILSFTIEVSSHEYTKQNGVYFKSQRSSSCIIQNCFSLYPGLNRGPPDHEANDIPM